jgi:Protein of unknown function (DUF2971)
VRRAIYFAPPRALNDPFDCYPSAVLSGTPEEHRKLIGAAAREEAKQLGIKIPKRRRESNLSKVMAGLTDPSKRGEMFFDHINNKTGIYCMSRSFEVASQWAYYADSHRGLCLEFTIRADAKFNSVYPVTYSPDRVEVDITAILRGGDNSEIRLFDAVTTKSSVWSSEREVRALKNPPGAFVYPPGMLTGVIFGVNADQADIDWLKSAAAGAGLSLSYSKMVPDAHHYLLHRVAL